jgi:hypothetical protein
VTYEEDPFAAFRRTSRHPVYRAGTRPLGALYSPRSAGRQWDRRPPFGRRRLLVGGAVVVAGVGAFFLWQRLSGSVSIDGLDDGAALGRSAVQSTELRVHVSGRGAPRATLNGAPFGTPERDGSTYVWHLPNLADGPYRLEVTADRLLFGTVSSTRSFTVDSVAPVLHVPATVAAVAIDQPVTIDGTVDEPVAVTADGARVDWTGTTFHLQLPSPPAAPIAVTATDRAGNATSSSVIVPVARPTINAVHATALAWGDPQLHAGVQALVDSHQVNAVELDLKDESGIVGYDSAVPLAKEIGAVQPSYSLSAAVADLHARGVRVVGRVVAFRDPVLAKAAWARGNKDWVVQDAAGQPLGAYGGFSNFANPDVQAYNLAIAEEAARAGVDEILWDYVRRPEGPLSSMAFPGLQGSVADAISGFLGKGQALLRPLKVLQGASVFGIAATRPDQVGQDVPAIARHTDYVAPMLYPSHWNRGEYGVADPNRQPYDIIKASLADFVAEVAPTGRPVAPWLQDFDDGVPYGDAEVQAQITAANELGVQSWFLWNPDTQYTASALPALAA